MISKHPMLFLVLIVLLTLKVGFTQSMPPGQLSRQQPASIAAKKALADGSAKATPNVACVPLNQAATKTTTAVTTTSVDSSGKDVAGSSPSVSTTASGPSTTYTFNRTFFPIWRKGCGDNGGAAILAYFAVDKTGILANQTQYLYNAKQSTNQINADLFTGTFFPGFQAVLSGTATAGSSQTANPANTATPSVVPGLAPRATTDTSSTSTQTDSVETAVAKLEQGGDFNVRFPFPIARKVGSNGAFDIKAVPNVGFDVNGLTGQNTVTESTEYALNIPLEGYFEVGSYEKTGGVSNVVLYGDFKAGADVISPGLKTAIGLTSNRYFFLGQAAVGVEFMNSIRVGVQYFLGPSQIYQNPTSTGTTTTVQDHLGGFHLVVSFSPTSSKTASK